MLEIMAAFITGLTTGGLSCFAVQGGLLTGSLTSEYEKGLQSDAKKVGKKEAGTKRFVTPILVFLVAKLFSHILLGFAFGWLGSLLKLTPLTRAVMQILIALFLIANALRMLNIHPIFRIFTFEPPHFISRWFRRKSKQNETLTTPLLLGVFSILIPCGVTQSVMAVAMASGNPLIGAAIMAAFILGSSPLFFAAVYFASQLSARLEKRFNGAVAVLLLLLGLYTLYTGLNLAGLGMPFTSTPAAVASSELPEVSAVTNSTPLTLEVRNNGYFPTSLSTPAGIPVKLALVTQNTRSCALAFTIPSLNFEQILPQTGTVTLELPAYPAGSVLKITCSMGMYNSEIRFQ